MEQEGTEKTEISSWLRFLCGLLLTSHERGKALTLSGDYFREKIAAGIAERDRGECQPWDVEQLKAELHRRHTASSAER